MQNFRSRQTSKEWLPSSLFLPHPRNLAGGPSSPHTPPTCVDCVGEQRVALGRHVALPDDGHVLQHVTMLLLQLAEAEVARVPPPEAVLPEVGVCVLVVRPRYLVKMRCRGEVGAKCRHSGGKTTYTVTVILHSSVSLNLHCINQN